MDLCAAPLPLANRRAGTELNYGRDPGDESDFTSGSRIRDPELMERLHFEFEECLICGCVNFTLHHVLSRSLGGDDVRENLVPLCGDGTSGCHGWVEENVDSVCRTLGLHIQRERPDVLAYLELKLESTEAAAEWCKRHLRLHL